MTAAPAALGPLLVAATTQKGFNPSILIFVIIGAAFFLIYRPQQRKQKAAREVGNSYDVGDEVVTAGGIVGRVLDITDDRVTLETSVGASFVVLKPYVLRKLEPVEPPTDVVDGTEHEDGDHEDHDHEDHDHEGPVPPPLPPEVDATEAHDRSQPTEPPPADDPDGTEGSGADGPPII